MPSKLTNRLLQTKIRQPMITLAEEAVAEKLRKVKANINPIRK